MTWVILCRKDIAKREFDPPPVFLDGIDMVYVGHFRPNVRFLVINIISSAFHARNPF